MPEVKCGWTGTTTAGIAAHSPTPACSCTTCWPLAGENPRQNPENPQNNNFYTHILVRNQAVLRNCYSPVYFFLQTLALTDTPSILPFVIPQLISLMSSPGAEKSTSDPSQKASGLVTVVSLFILFISVCMEIRAVLVALLCFALRTHKQPNWKQIVQFLFSIKRKGTRS